MIFKKLFTNTLYYPGCLTKKVLNTEFENYKEIFNKLKIDFILMPDDEVCCGLPVLNAGHKKEAKELAQKNLDAFKKRKVTKIITNCPSCYHMFNSVYPTLIREWDIPAEHATITVLNALKKRKIKLPTKEIVTYHDPCHLGRYSNIYEQPRKVIKRLGGEIIEMKNNRENSQCCAGGGGFRANYSLIAKKGAKLRTKQAPKKAKKIITPCGLCYSQLSGADERAVEFSTYVLGKLRGMKK